MSLHRTDRRQVDDLANLRSEARSEAKKSHNDQGSGAFPATTTTTFDSPTMPLLDMLKSLAKIELRLFLLSPLAP